MALDIKNKKTLVKKILPEIQFNVTSNGITLFASERLATPRFLPFDVPGACKECHGVDFVVTKEGVTLYSTRIKGSRFVPFDRVRDLPGYCIFRVRNKGRIFNVVQGAPEPQNSSDESDEHDDETPENQSEEQVQPNNDTNIGTAEGLQLLEEFLQNVNVSTSSQQQQQPQQAEQLRQLQMQAAESLARQEEEMAIANLQLTTNKQ